MDEACRGTGSAERFDLKTYLAERRARVEAALSGLWRPAFPDSRLTAAMAYSLGAGGKRLRPILCMAAAEAVGGDADAALPACCALEMVHTYSLIHDDLPAMDDDDLRRGKPTCHKAFEESTAILAGDGLLTLAFQLLSETGSRPGADAGAWMRVIRELSTAAGSDNMVEGQLRDLAAEGADLDLDALRRLHQLKTGAMIRASVAIGALLGGGSTEQQTALADYGVHIGLAFQVTDDILNVEGDPNLMGKQTGSDADKRKATYPRLMGLEASRAFADRLVEGALNALAKFDNRSDPLRAVAGYIVHRRR